MTGAPVTSGDNEWCGKAEEGEVPVVWWPDSSPAQGTRGGF